MCRCKLRKNPLLSILNSAAVILPAVLLGMAVMIAGGVSPVVWGQQAAACIVFGLLGLLRRAVQRMPFSIWRAVLLAALTATLFFPAAGGARRWLQLGVLNINAAMLVLPALLLLTAGMKHPHPALIFGAAVLCLQPDFSQLAALVLGALPILWMHRKNVCRTAASAVLLAVCVLRCISAPVELEPLAYCEGILAMAERISPLLAMAGGIALAFIPVCFFYRAVCEKSRALLCFGIYYAVIILFSLTGEYPVPFMGFGLSPIAGYWIAAMLAPAEE